MPAISAAPTVHFDGYDIPLGLMNKTGGGPDNFAAMSEFHINALQEHIGISPDHSVLEIGCGIGRDAIPLTKILSDKGTYTGIDIIGDSIQWCQRNIQTRYPNFQFIHLDIKDQLHNPGGYLTTQTCKIPVRSASIDRIFLWSVFTHMDATDIVHYLREFVRTLTPDGLVYTTWFIFDDNILKKAREVNLTPFDLRFEHKFGEGCRINSLNAPMGAVGYTEAKLREMISDAGLELVGNVLPGMWSGYHEVPKGGQDATILRKKI